MTIFLLSEPEQLPVHMAAQLQEEDTQHSLRIGDTVLLYAKERKGFIFSKLSSEQHNSVALFETESFKDPNLPNVHFASFKVISANKFKAQKELDAFKTKKAHHLRLEGKEYLRLLERVKHEGEENRAEQERLQGSTLLYGEKIQLLHTASKKYLIVNTSETSRIEHANLRVELTSKNSESCIFKILPRYKVRSVGDEVRYNDQVKLESFKTKGQFLHCSNHRYRSVFSALEQCFELNLSATESALMIVPHYRPMPSHDPKALKGGGVVRLFHRENECYVSAEGSFAEIEDITEDVYCQKRPSKFGRLKQPSTSANVFWQFEKESDGRSGEPLSWGERCRIKHLPTRRYLAVVCNGGQHEVILKERSVSSTGSLSEAHCGSETVFSLFPVIKEKDTILVESYARIKHLQSRTWLHLDKGTEFQRSSFKPSAQGLEGLQWDGAELFRLTATEVMNYDDAFTLEVVTEQLVDNFNFVAGIVPILTAHVRKYCGEAPQPLDHKNAKLVQKALKNLSDFMSTANERENKNRQKLLRNLKVLELIIKVLSLFKAGASDESEQLNVCKECYGVIESYLKGNSRKNENYLARFMEFFKTQIGMGLNAEEVMIEMVENNSAIVSKMAAETEIDYMIKQLVETKDPRFMDFLGNLCVCEDRAIPSTQNMILNKLVYQHGKDVFYTTAIGRSAQYPEGDGDEVYVCCPGKTDWSVVSDVVEQEKECSYMESQLNLFARMCSGSNRTIIYALDEHDQRLITFEEALQCAKNTALKPSLRSKYVRLITVMYVDVEDNRNVLENLSLSFVYDDVAENSHKDTVEKDTVALTGVENVNFPSLRDWIKEHLECAAKEKVVALEKEENALLADVIQVLNLFVKYGYYDDYRDADQLLRHLLDVLNGFTDLPYRSEEEEHDNEFTKTRRFKETAETKPIFDIKTRIMEVINLLFNFQVYIRLQRFVYDFRLLELKEDYSNEAGHSTLEQLATKSIYELAMAQCRESNPPADLRGLFSDSVNLNCEKFSLQVTELTRERLHHIFSQNTFHFEDSDYFFENSNSERNLKLPDVLIDLSQYEDPRLLQNSLHLLNRFYSSDMTLFEMAVQTQLLSAPRSCEVFSDIRKLQPILQYHISVDTGESGRAKIIQILRQLTKLCHLDDNDESHPQNQKILYNSGLFSTVLSYVLRISKFDTFSSMSAEEGNGHSKRQGATIRKQRTLSEVDDHDNADIESVCVECFKFLKALAKDYFQVQERLYDDVGDLLEVDIGVASMAEVVAEIFTGRPELCLKVREDQIAKVFTRIAQKELPQGRPELLYALQTMAKVENLDLTVKKNQAFIVTHFSKTREKFCDHLLGEGKKEENVILASSGKEQGSGPVESKRKDSKLARMELLTKATNGDTDLCLLLSLTDLLASCCEGENPFIESVCQIIFSMEELFDIVNCDYIVAERKRPFARFLVYVYLTCSSGKYSISLPMTRDLINSKMEDYLGTIATYLYNIGKVLNTLPSSKKSLVRQGLSSASRRYISYQSVPKKIQSESKAVPFITGEDGQLLPGVLLYFSDGLLPLLRAYYKNFFQKSLLSGNKFTLDIATALIEMAGALVEHLTTDTQMKLYRGTVLTVLEKCGEELIIDDQILTVFETKTKDCKGYETLTKKQYNNTYANEIELNKTFHSYVTNFQLAYQGPNTAQAQIGSTYTTCYSDEIEPLPLGLNFQRHVACFVDQHARKQCDVVRPCVERLLAQVESSLNRLKGLSAEDRRKQYELDIKSLQIMRAIIHNEIVNIDPDLKDRDPIHYRKRCRSRIHPIQNSIQDIRKAVSCVLPLLSHPNEEVICEVLAFLKAMFYSGNRHVQEGMNIVFKTREETIFKTMGCFLQNAAILFNDSRSLLSQAEARYEDEIMLKKNPLAAVSGQARPSHSPDDLVIDIEISIISPELAISSSAKLKEEDDTKENWMAEIEPHVTVKPRLRRRQPEATKNIELEVLETASASDHDEQNKEATEMVLMFKESRHVKLALRVLGLMCDGQYRNMQNYLREQKDNLTSVNVVEEVALFVQNFTSDINRDTMDLVHLILQTLIEMCVGNLSNQLVIYNRQIIEALNHIFAMKIFDKDKKARDTITEGTIRDSVHLKGSAIELFDIMLEKTDERSEDLVCDIVNGLDIEALHYTLKEFYELMNDPIVKEKGYDDEAETGLFHTYHALVHITDYGVPPEKIEPKLASNGEGDSDSEISSDDKKLSQVWEFCKSRSKRVEVLYKNDNGHKILTRIHFPFDPHQELREEVIENIKWNINHDSPEDKLRDFLEWMKAVKRDTFHSARLHKFLPTKILTSHPSKRHILLVLWSILMSIFTLMAFTVPSRISYDEHESSDFFNASGAIRPNFLSYWRGAYRPVLFTFGSFHLFLSVWMVLEYFIVNWPNFKLPRPFYSLVTRFTKREAPEELYTDVSVFGLRTIYAVVFLLCSILSLFFDGYFYCICLLHIIVNNDILKRVLKSVTKNGISLLWVAALGLVVLYIYAVVSFAFLHESFEAPDSEVPLFCSTLYECFATTIRYGLIDHLGLVVPLFPREFSVSALRLFYDVSFFIIFTTIGLNIVFGIIVDTFSELRDERFRSEEDKKNFCFICNLASHEFERRAEGFNHHVKHDHNMWDYIYLSIYLDQIDISDHNAIQKFVHDTIAREKYDFFPLFHALALEEEEDKTEKQLDELKSMVEKVLQRFEEEERQKSLHSKRQEQRKWEEQNLRQESSLDAGMSFDRAALAQAGLQRGSVDFTTFQKIPSPFDEP